MTLGIKGVEKYLASDPCMEVDLIYNQAIPLANP